MKGPRNLEAERCVLHGMLRGPEGMEAIKLKLGAGAFTTF